MPGMLQKRTVERSCFSHLWVGGLLHWLAELCPPACGEEPFSVCGRGQGRDVGRMTGGQLFPLSSKKSLSSSVKKYPWWTLTSLFGVWDRMNLQLVDGPVFTGWQPLIWQRITVLKSWLRKFKNFLLSFKKLKSAHLCLSLLVKFTLMFSYSYMNPEPLFAFRKALCGVTSGTIPLPG